MKRLLTAAILCATITAIATAQTAKADNGADANVSIAALRSNWLQAVGNITKAAEELSEADYAYRPVATVRTFGEIVGHVAGSQNLMCAAALGDKQPAEDAVEKVAKSKVAILKALHESVEYCTKAYAITGATAGMSTQLFGETSTRVGALALNAVHDGEHYGNIVTYMRMKGMVPPSSRR